jgi:hypothetical protein
VERVELARENTLPDMGSGIGSPQPVDVAWVVSSVSFVHRRLWSASPGMTRFEGWLA